MYYELHESYTYNKYRTGSTPKTVIHQLDFENIADIQACLRIVNEIKKAIVIKNGKIVGGDAKVREITHRLPNIECLPETIEKMSEVTVPVTDY